MLLGCESWSVLFCGSSSPVVSLKASMSLAVPMPVIIQHHEDGDHVECEPCDHNL
jgi:hypothetical protein